MLRLNAAGTGVDLEHQPLPELPEELQPLFAPPPPTAPSEDAKEAQS